MVRRWSRHGTGDRGACKQQRGWLWLRTEQAAPAIWMVPMTAEKVAALIAAAGATPYPLTGVSTHDAPAPGLARWLLDSNEGPVQAAVVGADTERPWRECAGVRRSDSGLRPLGAEILAGRQERAGSQRRTVGVDLRPDRLVGLGQSLFGDRVGR